jgi:hypothetical protein
MKWVNGKIIFESAREAEDVANDIGNAAIVVQGQYQMLEELGSDETDMGKFFLELCKKLGEMCNKTFEMADNMDDKKKTIKLADKKVKDLTEDDLLEILICMRDSDKKDRLTPKKWRGILDISFVTQNFLEEKGLEMRQEMTE